MSLYVLFCTLSILRFRVVLNFYKGSIYLLDLYVCRNTPSQCAYLQIEKRAFVVNTEKIVTD